MTRRALSLGLLILCAAPLGGCSLLKALQGDPAPNCAPRKPFWPDANGDGVGDVGAVYIGCTAPKGYVDVPPPSDTDDSDALPIDTDVADTDVVDTDAADTDVADTDAADTDLADTDLPPTDTDALDTDTPLALPVR